MVGAPSLHKRRRQNTIPSSGVVHRLLPLHHAWRRGKKHSMAHAIVAPRRHGMTGEEIVELGAPGRGDAHGRKTKAWCTTSERPEMLIGCPQRGLRSRRSGKEVAEGVALLGLIFPDASSA